MSFDPKALLKEFDADKLEALVETMLLAAQADGEVSDEERTQLATSIRALARGTSHESALTPHMLEAMIQRAQHALVAEGRVGRIAAVKGRLGDESARRAALGMAIAVTAADGVVRTSERELIFDLAHGLELDPDTAADLVRTITRA